MFLILLISGHGVVTAFCLVVINYASVDLNLLKGKVGWRCYFEGAFVFFACNGFQFLFSRAAKNSSAICPEILSSSSPFTNPESWSDMHLERPLEMK